MNDGAFLPFFCKCAQQNPGQWAPLAAMKQATPHRLALLQESTVRWHKASGGAPGAVARNRVPETLALPTNLPVQPWPVRLSHLKPKILPSPDLEDDRAAHIYLRHIFCGEDSQFQTPRTQYWITLCSRLPAPSASQLPYANAPPLTLTGADDTLQAQFEWAGAVAAPLRDYRGWREQAALEAGRWMQSGATAATFTLKTEHGTTRSMWAIVASLTLRPRSIGRCPTQLSDHRLR